MIDRWPNDLPLLDLIGVGPMGGDELVFLLRDDFSVDEAAPLASPRTCVPGPGTLTLTDTTSVMSISGGKAVLVGGPSLYDPGGKSEAYSRNPGLALFLIAEEVASSIEGMGWNATNLNRNESDLWIEADGNTIYDHNAYSMGLFLDLSSGICGILRNKGLFVLEGSVLKWIDISSDDTTLHAIFSSYNGQYNLDTFRVARLPGLRSDAVPGNGYDEWGGASGTGRDLDLCSAGEGDGTSYIASPSALDTFVHTPDFAMRFVFTTLPSSGTTTIVFRKQDTNNNLFMRWAQSVGAYQLWKQKDGTPTILGSWTGGANGDVVDLIAVGDSIAVFVNNTLEISGSTTVAMTATDGTINPGTGGVISDFAARTLDGVYNASSANFPGYGIATDVLPGPLAEDDAFTHEADGQIEAVYDAVPSAGTVSFDFRIKDAINYWEVRLNSSGDFYLWEFVGGSSYPRASATGVLSGGERIVMYFRDEVIKGYYDNTLAWTWNSASNFKTETDANIRALGTGGQLSDLICWPADLAAAPNTPGAAKANAGITRMGA